MDRYIKHKDLIEFNNSYNNGIETLNLSSWDKFSKVVEKFNEFEKPYIWRGQRQDWQLKSSFDRRSYYGLITSIGKREEILNELFNEFKHKLDELKRVNPEKLSGIDLSNLTEESKDKIWAIGQQYGLLTPILDWTENPYISAYFAFYKKYRNEHSNRIVYALDIRYLKRLMKGEERFVKYLDFKDIYDKELNKRIKEQKSVFTKSFNGTDIEENISILVKKRPGILKEKEIILSKIFIPNKFRFECLDYLKRKEGIREEITHVKLFSDFHGAVEACKINTGLI